MHKGRFRPKIPSRTWKIETFFFVICIKNVNKTVERGKESTEEVGFFSTWVCLWNHHRKRGNINSLVFVIEKERKRERGREREWIFVCVFMPHWQSQTKGLYPYLFWEFTNPIQKILTKQILRRSEEVTLLFFRLSLFLHLNRKLNWIALLIENGIE